jgi:Antitoxin VbhA
MTITDGGSDPDTNRTVVIGLRRHPKAVIVPAAVWDAMINERRRASEQTDASLRLEGLTRSPAARAINERYVNGEIDVAEMVRQTIALYTGT